MCKQMIFHNYNHCHLKAEGIEIQLKRGEKINGLMSIHTQAKLNESGTKIKLSYSNLIWMSSVVIK